jgi:hypothetical protein
MGPQQRIVADAVRLPHQQDRSRTGVGNQTIRSAYRRPERTGSELAGSDLLQEARASVRRRRPPEQYRQQHDSGYGRRYPEEPCSVPERGRSRGPPQPARYPGVQPVPIEVTELPFDVASQQIVNVPILYTHRR